MSSPREGPPARREDGATPASLPPDAAATPHPDPHAEAIARAASALDDIWQLARSRLYQPRHLTTWWGLNRRFNLRMVRPSRVKVLVPKGTLPDCEACLELCCTGPNAVVSLRLRDIAVLEAAGLGGAIVARDPRSLAIPAGSSERKRVESTVFARMFPVLARDATGTCRLLSTERQCSAWPHWPLSCARYPYAFDAENDVVFLASGCRSHRMVTLDDPPRAVSRLVDAAVHGYNERIKDIVALHLALPELFELGLLRYLQLEGDLLRRARALGYEPSAPRKALPIVE